MTFLFFLYIYWYKPTKTKKMSNWREKRPIYVSPNVLRDFKEYCKSNGLKMGFVLDKVVTEFLNNKKQC